MHGVTATVIINTHNRAPYLRRLLPALERQVGVGFEVVVVNGPSTDDTESVLAAYAGRIKIVRCPTRNLSQSRNLGIAAAAGDIVVFIDDDALPIDERWLLRFAEAFAGEAGGRLGAVGGPVIHRDGEVFEFNGGATSDYAFQVFDVQTQRKAAVDNRRWFLRVPGGNSAYRRDTLVALGGFDEYFVYYLDEADLCVRMIRSGAQVRLLADNAIRHYPAASERRTSKYDRNWRTITRSDTYYALKNSRDALPLRLARTLGYAPRKHFFQEIASYRAQREISRRHYARLLGEWAAGLLDGLRDGLTRPRRLGSFTAAPPAFLPFPRPAPPRRLRVALLTQTIPGQPGYGGVGRYTFDLARGLHERGHEVHIICRDESPLHHYSLGWQIHGIAAAECAPAPGDPQPVLAKNLAYSAAVVRRLRQLHEQGIELDVVHASNWDAEAAALIRAQLYPVALMLVSPLAQVIQTEQWAADDDLRACITLDRWQIEQADAVCVPSQGVLSSYRRLMGVEPERLRRLTTTTLGIVPDAAGPAPARPGAPRRLLFVGRLERRKGAHTLLAALPALLGQFPGWECHLVGNDQVQLEGGTLKAQFLAAHSGAPWLGRVRFHGQVSEAELREHYRGCDLFVAPSLFESFGLIYHEAMQYGKAVVGCRTGGVPEVVADGEDGLLVAPDAPAELGAALARLMGDGALRERLGRAGLRRVQELMNYRTMAAALERVYLDLAGELGAERAAARRRAWQRPLPLFGETPLLRRRGPWQRRESGPGQAYLVGAPGAALEFTAAGGSLLSITALRHGWSGVVQIRLGAAEPCYLDLYQAEGVTPEHTQSYAVAGASGEEIPVRIEVFSEHNPAALGSEAWLRQIRLVGGAECSSATNGAEGSTAQL